ncbi:MAG: 23S rRNA (adenine(2503)-C(2))-methyltransferase RlmN [Pirellulales bacterium]|nr:23S rRNA (adenine(2503)-C(2))-methyltransferase RlmN [Pirellulales bacterium]
MLPILAQSPVQLEAWFRERGLPAYRARQVRKWIFERRAAGFDEMTDLPLDLRGRLAEEFSIWSGRVAAHAKSADGAEKLLFEQADGNRVECVLLRDDRRHRTICLSSQIGCAMQCAFCATGIDGFVRNLSAEEIVEHALQLQRLLPDDERLSNVVVMGMGEPLLNLDGVLPALAAIASPEGLGIGVRRITISTVGLPKGIRQLAEMNCLYHLAVSLHAPNDELRERLVPANRGVGIGALLSAADYYFEKTGRRVTYEYVLLAEINDRPEHARQLAEILRGRPSLVNLIPYNPTPDLPFRTPASAVTAQFAEILAENGLTTAIRYRKGDRISAACGQLRRSHS